MKKYMKMISLPMWGLMLVFAFGLPILANTLNFSLLFTVVGVYMLANGLFSIWMSHTLNRRGAFVWMLLIWPGLFAIAVVCGLVPGLYGYAFAGFYFVLEALTFYAGQRNDQDYEDQIPIEHGYHEV